MGNISSKVSVGRKEAEVRAGVCGGANTQNFRAAHNQPSKRLGKQSGAHQSSSQITNDTFRTVPMTSVNGDLSLPQNHLHVAVDFHAELTQISDRALQKPQVIYSWLFNTGKQVPGVS